MHSSSYYTLILVSIQRGLPPIFENIGTQTTSAKMLQLILKTLGKTVKIIYKGVFKCISVVYKFSTMLLKKGCNTVEKVIRMPVEMWKTKYQLVVQILCGKLYRMGRRLGHLNVLRPSDLREHCNTNAPKCTEGLYIFIQKSCRHSVYFMI